MILTDTIGRRINYLRLSVTDRCNMRCSYCMPKNGVPLAKQGDILSYEQMLMLAQCAVSVGIEKIRVTGGEPLVRKGIIDFLSRLAQIHGLKQLVLTTNGLDLESMAPRLKKSGVHRLNISLDSLHPETFKQITRRDVLPKVLAGIKAAEQNDLQVKINMVVMRGINDNELLDFVALTLNQSCSVRFIEYMPVTKAENWQSLVVSGEEILERIARYCDYTPLIKGELNGPAREYKISGARGSIGVITALSGHFCGDCNRIRVTAAGKVKTCLFSDDEHDLSAALNRGDSGAVKAALHSLVESKPTMHTLLKEGVTHQAFTMAQVGG